MTDTAQSVYIEEYEVGDGGDWDPGIIVDMAVSFWLDPEVKGSHYYFAPSDVDYHGKPATVDGIESVSVNAVYTYDGDSSVPVDLAQWEIRVIETHIRRTISDDVIMEALCD